MVAATELPRVVRVSAAILSGLGAAGATLGQAGGVHRGLCAVGHAELAEQVRDVVLDGLLGEEHLGGDLAVGQAVGEVVEDGRLLRRQDVL